MLKVEVTFRYLITWCSQVCLFGQTKQSIAYQQEPAPNDFPLDISALQINVTNKKVIDKLNRMDRVVS